MLAICGCTRAPSEDNRILAQVSNKCMTVRDFKNRINKLPVYYRDVVKKNEKRFLDETIAEMLFFEEAVRKGVDKDPEVREVVREATKKVVITKLIKNEVDDKVGVSEDEMRRFYEANREKFKSPALWRVSHILVPTENKAQELLSEIGKGAKFEDLARNNSTDATASRGGDIGYFRAGQLVPDFENAALKLKPGELSGVVHTQFGYHIIKLTDKRDAAVESYEKVKSYVEIELKRKKRAELFDKLVQDLKKKYSVDIKEDVFESMQKQEKGGAAT
jgi:peptidyl-prolyl cis-trans isomerase C